jgi:hypothetical protein
VTPSMHRAGPAEIADVLAVLDEAAAWLAEHGVRQWPRAESPGRR